MEKTLEFPVLLQLIDERSAAFRAAVADAARLDAQVPTCPEWTLFDLVRHLGRVHLFWAATVAVGPAGTHSAEAADASRSPAPREPDALLAWSADATAQLLDALRAAGPDRGCWTWWGASQSPQTAGAVARHQVQEALVHTYDAELTASAAQSLLFPPPLPSLSSSALSPSPELSPTAPPSLASLPEVAALDGIDEFLTTSCATTNAWPHRPAVLDFHATEGRSWRLTLDAGGARATPLTDPTAPAPAPDAAVRGTAAGLLLALYSRIPLDSLKLDGDREVFEQLQAWESED